MAREIDNQFAIACDELHRASPQLFRTFVQMLDQRAEARTHNTLFATPEDLPKLRGQALELHLLLKDIYGSSDRVKTLKEVSDGESLHS